MEGKTIDSGGKKDDPLRGHCGPTTEIGDCSAGASGSFGGRDWSSWSKAAHWCLQRCARCARCQFISVSLAERDCSWFASCSKLHDSPRIFRSGPALPKPSEALQLFHTATPVSHSTLLACGSLGRVRPAMSRWGYSPLQRISNIAPKLGKPGSARQTWARACMCTSLYVLET